MDRTDSTGGDGEIPSALSTVLTEMRDGIHTGRADIIEEALATEKAGVPNEG